MLKGFQLQFRVARYLAINWGGSRALLAFDKAYGYELVRRDLISGLFGLYVLVGALLFEKSDTISLGKVILHK